MRKSYFVGGGRFFQGARSHEMVCGKKHGGRHAFRVCGGGRGGGEGGGDERWGPKIFLKKKEQEQEVSLLKNRSHLGFGSCQS